MSFMPKEQEGPGPIEWNHIHTHTPHIHSICNLLIFPSQVRDPFCHLLSKGRV